MCQDNLVFTISIVVMTGCVSLMMVAMVINISVNTIYEWRRLQKEKR